ncbi:tRNA lysidine(34) synthetase TilS [bacterium]|nr:tRNA lysidine(34) synthetase TilS [candidate division CSSED10-310 bacterium]
MFEFINSNNLWDFTFRIVVAVSGGCDSTALLHTLFRLARHPEKSLIVAHLDHAYREDSGEDARFVAQLAAFLGLAFRSERLHGSIPKGVSREFYWRESRYRFLEKIRREERAGAIATAHTADDQLETVLFRLIKGCGPRGLLGILPRTENRVIRPLLASSRSAVVNYLLGNGYAFRTDPTNLDCSIPRNHIRIRLIPLIEELNPRIRESVQSCIQLIGNEDEWMSSISARIFDSICGIEGSGIRLPFQTASQMPDPLLRRLVFHLLKMIGVPEYFRIDQSKVRSVLDLLTGKKKNMRLFPDIRGTVRGNWIFIYRKPAADYIFSHPVHLDGPGSIDFGSYRIRAQITGVPAGFPDPSKSLYLKTECMPFRVRTALPGDRFQHIGMHGSMNLKKFLSGRKLPADLHTTIPLIVDRRTNAIVGVVGHGVSVRGALDVQATDAVKLTWKQR